jgi:hypothetical protein
VIIPALYEAASRPLKGWMNARPEALERVALRAQRSVAGKVLGKRDVGAKIGGARKDLSAIRRMEQLAALESQGAGVAYKAVTKDAVLGTFDPHVAKAAGDSAGAAYLKAEAYRAVAARPEDTPSARKRFLEGCAYLREVLAPARTVDEVYQVLREWSRAALHGTRAAETITRAEFTERYGSDVRTMDRLLAAGFSGYADVGDRRVLHKRERGLDVQLQEMIAALGDRAYGVVHGRGRSYRSSARPVFHDDARTRARIYERNDDWSWATAEAETPAGQKKRSEFVFVRAGLTGMRQGGPAVSGVTGARLRETFNLRGVEHGVWMSDSDSDTGENSAYGALLDLSLVMGVQASALGLGGRLGLALGARGGGAAAAHYEPALKVINLTKTRGAGTLAHEWGHALDHFLADPDGHHGRATYCSGGNRCGIPAVDAAFRAVMAAILGTGGLPALQAASKLRANPEPRVSLEPLADWPDWTRRVEAMNVWYGELKEMRKRSVAEGDEALAKAYRAGMDEYELTRQALEKLKAKLSAQERAGAKAKQAQRAAVGLSNYARGAALLGEYWARPTELFARAWEAAIEDLLAERGWVSGYLVTGTKQPYAVVRKDATGADVVCEVYPQGEERVAITGAMRGLIAALRSNW